MKYILMLISLFIIGCENLDNLTDVNRDFEGEYYDGQGTIDSEEILFMFVSEFPSDRSLFVQFTTPTNVYACRYFYINRIDNVNSYVSDPIDLAVIKLNIKKRITLSFYSEPAIESDPCKKINSELSFNLFR